MTEESKETLRFLLNNTAEKEIQDAITWATIYERRALHSWHSKTPYMVASLVYIYETANKLPNNIGKSLCELIDDFDEVEAMNILSRFRFPVSSIYNVIKDWENTHDIPHVFNEESLIKEYELLHAAAARDDLDMVVWLLKFDIHVDIKDSAGKTALHVAAAGGKMRVTRSLLRSGASIFSLDNQHQTPIEVALQFCKFEIAEFLKPSLFCNLRMDDGDTLLMKLIRYGLIPQVQYMLYYADFCILNYSDQNLLHVCADAKQEKIMELLLAENISSEMLNAKDKFNHAPLYIAILKNNYVIVEQLLKSGAKITPIIKRMTANKAIKTLLERYTPLQFLFSDD